MRRHIALPKRYAQNPGFAKALEMAEVVRRDIFDGGFHKEIGAGALGWWSRFHSGELERRRLWM
jgi:hypothetical protein